MACNPVTFLKEIQGYPQDTCNYESIKSALGYSMVGDCLDFDHWLMLDNACKNKDWISLQSAIYEILPFYAMLLGFLDNPRTAEEWQRALYMEGRKSTSRRKMIQKMLRSYKETLHKD